MDEKKKIDFEKFRQTQQLDEIGNIFNSLVEVSNDTLTKLPEAIFINNFLPMFAGDPVPSHIDLNTWFGIAGNPYMPVKIVDQAGEVLYTVPAFFDRGAIDHRGADETAAPLTHVLKTTEQLQKVHPIRARNYFEDQLNRRNITKEDEILINQNALTWIAIFERYNKPLPPYLQQFKSAGITAPPASGEAQQQASPGGDLQFGDDIL